MPLAPTSKVILWAESNQQEKVPSDFTEPSRGIWKGTYLNDYLGLKCKKEKKKKKDQVRAMDMEKLWNL